MLLLQDAGFEVVCVETGDAALAQTHALAFDLLVAGVTLRGLDALALVRALRGLPQYAAPPMLLMSADPDPERMCQAMEAGATALLRKSSLADEQLSGAVGESLGRAA
jgi:two-component system chemotaxis response regulator CheY